MVKKIQFELSRVQGASVSDAELLSDLKRVAQLCNSEKVSHSKYEEFGTYDCKTISRRFGSWNKALLLAGLSISNEVYISDDRLFENMLKLWQHYGRQPRKRELARAPSTISEGPYKRRFSSWIAALKEFIDYANSSEGELPNHNSRSASISRHKINRNPSLRLRWKVLKRDRFTCCSCGASPAIKIGVQLHVDHVIPYSKGGEAVLCNLQTLCSVCNSGKSNLT